MDTKPDALMLRFPDVSSDRIVFVYAGDIWVVPKAGGVASRLSSPRGSELFPKFSPDGADIAFSGNYDGNTDIYVMPSGGGVPERITHHPDDDLVAEWYPDGKSILFRSNMLSPTQRYNRLFKVSKQGGMPEALPLPYGELGSFSPDGQKLAFEYMAPMRGVWKRYKGGMASDIWIYDFSSGAIEKLTDFPGTDTLPMWRGDRIYFLSDRGEEKKLNLWVYETGTKKTRQVTDFAEFDVKWPSLGPDDIVFENGGRLYLLSLPDETVSEVSVEVPYDLPEVRPRQKDLSDNISDMSVSPNGKRALFEARGEVLTVPAGEGSVRNLTNTSGVAERFPAWSPDGKYVAYLSDRSGEYELYMRLSNGEGEEQRITNDGKVYRYHPVWSPDSRKLAFSDKTGRLFIVDTSGKVPKEVDKDDYEGIGSYSWSPDSRWLAYAKSTPNNLRSIFIYDTKSGVTRRVTSDFYNDNGPVFDPDGKYLYFYSDRGFSPVYGDMDDTWVYPNSTQVYAVTLRKDTQSPIAPRSEEEYSPGKDSQKETAGTDGGVAIDFGGIEDRAVKIPVDAGNFGPLNAAKGRIVYLRFPPAGSGKDSPNGVLQFFDLGDRKEKTVIAGISDYALSANGAKALYRSGDTYSIIDLSEGKNPGDGRIDVGGMKAFVDPRKEWSQIFNDAWRIERDFFYDPGMHGVDWQAVRERYRKLLPFVVDREDLNYVISEMVGELNSSHTYVGGGDMDEPETVPVGLLGIDFELDKKNNAYRIKKIYSGGEFNADIYSPLAEPGVNVGEGDYILAVNGRKLDTARDPWEAFQGLNGTPVTLTVNSAPDEQSARKITVKVISKTEEQKLRYLDRVAGNMKKVDKATGGRVGYVYVPDTGILGQNELVRQFTPQTEKEGIIIDERFNGGGQVPDRFIELLNRPNLNYWAVRDFKDSKTPTVSNDGPKVMMINGWSGSGGDAFPYYFRKAGLGPLVGTRTLGGLIGISGNPGLIDGGYITAPGYAFWNSHGKWEIEGYGVEPDYEVEDLPPNIKGSQDPQLDKAIEIITDLLEKNPPAKPERPKYEDRSGAG
ncbi:MAG: PDZ domain-containing protein [Thermodesulfobacteriota bacterium]